MARYDLFRLHKLQKRSQSWRVEIQPRVRRLQMALHQMIHARTAAAPAERHQVQIDDALAERHRQKCERAVKIAQRLLTAKQFGHLLGQIKFQNGPIMGHHRFFDRRNSLAIIDGAYYDLPGTVDSLIHQLGHKLYCDQSFVQKAKTYYKHRDPEVRRMVGAFRHSSYRDIFSEVFRLYIRGRVDADQARWLASLARSGSR